MPIRVESYIHSDSITQGKGGCLVAIEAQTDFALKSDYLIAFAKKTARVAFGYGESVWTSLVQVHSEIQEELENVRKLLKEDVQVKSIACIDSDGLITSWEK